MHHLRSYQVCKEVQLFALSASPTTRTSFLSASCSQGGQGCFGWAVPSLGWKKPGLMGVGPIEILVQNSAPGPTMWPWVKIQIVPPVNIPIPTNRLKWVAHLPPNGTIGFDPQPYFAQLPTCLPAKEPIAQLMDSQQATSATQGSVCSARPSSFGSTRVEISIISLKNEKQLWGSRDQEQSA